jgi:hypothetical protein
MRKHSTENTASHVNKIDQKTSPPGMAPDMAHASKKIKGDTRETQQEETFDSSSANAGSKQSSHVSR